MFRWLSPFQRYSRFNVCDRKNVGQSHDVTTFAVEPYDGNNRISYLMAIVLFAFFQSLLVKIATWKVWPWKCRSRSRSTTFALIPFDGEYQTLHKSFLSIFASSHRFWDIHISKLVTLQMQIKVMTYNNRSGAIWWKIPDFLSDDNNNVCIFKHLIVKITICKVWPWRLRWRSLTTTFAVMPFDGKHQSS